MFHICLLFTVKHIFFKKVSFRKVEMRNDFKVRTQRLIALKSPEISNFVANFNIYNQMLFCIKLSEWNNQISLTAWIPYTYIYVHCKHVFSYY